MKYFLKIFLYLYCLLIYLLCNKYLSATELNVDSLILSGIEQSIQQNYFIAEKTFATLIESDKNNPQGYFFLAAVLQSKMMDYETDIWEEKFISLLDKTEIYANKILNKNDKDIWAYFYLGSAFSYRAFYEGRNKDYISSIKYAMSGISSLNKIIEINPQFYDAYFGIGSYKYWRSKATRYINWLPLLSDERDQGIEMVKQAALKGTYTKYAAINQLTWILIDNGKVTDALKWANIGMQKYPNSRFFLWGAAKSHFNLHNYTDALLLYKKILNSILKFDINNHYNEVICYYKIAQCNYNLAKYDEAKLFYDKIFTLKIKQKEKKKLKDIYKKLDDLNVEIYKKNNLEKKK